jgi:hypothetical protein
MNSLQNFIQKPGRELAALAVLVGLFLLVNFSVATRTPTVNNDEPGYADPAANLYFGAGFTSTQWGQDRHEFWSGNVPLYQGILFCAYKVIGFGLFQTRIVNSLLAVAAVMLIWSGVRRAGLVTGPDWRVLMVALMLSGSSTTVTFRTVRPDTTMFLVCALVFYLWERAGNSWQRRFVVLPACRYCLSRGCLAGWHCWCSGNVRLNLRSYWPQVGLPVWQDW